MSSNSTAEIFARVHRQLAPGAEPPRFAVVFRPRGQAGASWRFDFEAERIEVRLSDSLRDASAEALESVAAEIISELSGVPPAAGADRSHERRENPPHRVAETRRLPAAPLESLCCPEQIFRRAFRQLHPRACEVPCHEIRFRPFAALRSNVRFDKSTQCVRADLSDLLEGAPSAVMESVATMLLCKLYGRPVPTAARRLYARWLYRPGTQQRIDEMRRLRGRVDLLPARGQVHDLDALFDQINRTYFEGTLRKPRLGWSRHAARKRLGRYDAAHDAIAISRIFDAPGVPALALEFVLFHEMLHVKHPARLEDGRRLVHTPEFRADERRFAQYAESRRLLRSLGMSSGPERC